MIPKESQVQPVIAKSVGIYHSHETLNKKKFLALYYEKVRETGSYTDANIAQRLADGNAVVPLLKHNPEGDPVVVGFVINGAQKYQEFLEEEKIKMNTQSPGL